MKGVVLLVGLASMGVSAATLDVYSFNENKSMGALYPDREGLYTGNFEYNYKIKGVAASVVTLYGGGKLDDIYMSIINHDRADARQIVYAVKGNVVNNCDTASSQSPVRSSILVEQRKVEVYEVCDSETNVKFYTPIDNQHSQYVVGQYLLGEVAVTIDGVDVTFDAKGFAYVWDLLDRRLKVPKRL
ncbi:hypothetical protein [Vibrio owensii]|uniref:hypothetical protein n=1 Tax=Vibrio owensii TaxID=696485 RepID=UPI0018F18729|nr:hypothetical protein [Vibrio owensii]